MPKVVLVVEDDNTAYELLEKAFGALAMKHRLFRARDGAEALEFVRSYGRHADSPRPDVIFLNLDLPEASGFKVLTKIQEDPKLKSIPAVVFSSSKLDADCAKCLASGAKDYIVKPDNYEGLLNAIKRGCGHAEFPIT